eukprot:scaffold122671_cov27-Attheya_sp.AAC.1
MRSLLSGSVSAIAILFLCRWSPVVNAFPRLPQDVTDPLADEASSVFELREGLDPGRHALSASPIIDDHSEISEGAEAVFEKFEELINQIGVGSIDAHRDNRTERHTRSQATVIEQRSSASMPQMRSSNRTSWRINAVTESHDTRAQDGTGLSSLINLPVPNVSGGSPGLSEDKGSSSQDERQNSSDSEELDYADESQSCGSSNEDEPNTAPKNSRTRIQVSTGTTTGRSRRSATKKISYEEADCSDVPEATNHDSDEESDRSPPRAQTKKRTRYSPRRAGAGHLTTDMSDPQD